MEHRLESRDTASNQEETVFKQIKEHWVIVSLLILALCVVSIVSYITIKSEIAMYAALKELSATSHPVSIRLDFSNESGYARITGGFTDLLVGSRGASKKGEGYVVKLSTNNPSSNVMTSSRVIYSWVHNKQNLSVTITNPNAMNRPGTALMHTAFLSPLEGDELKSIWVTVDYDFVSSYR